ncbi:MAG: cytochrome C oxidase subunit IV family protein [Planctomycetota bacterium]
MSTAAHDPNAAAFDQYDPHGFHADEGHDHGHVIVPWQTLTLVLLALLFFTMLTVFQARVEIYAAYEWGWQIPGWVNIVLAMAIATVKGTLVVLYFMQLRYDRGVNGILFLFTIFAVWLFLMFTMIDLNGRNTITEWRAGEIVSGGSGIGISVPAGRDAEGNPIRAGLSGSIVDHARESYIAEKGYTQEEYDKKFADKHAGHHGDHHENSKDHSRVPTGLTPGLFETGPWAEIGKDDHGHHDGHGDDADHSGESDQADVSETAQES